MTDHLVDFEAVLGRGVRLEHQRQAALNAQSEQRLAHLVAIRRRLTAGTKKLRAVDLRHQQGGQIRLFDESKVSYGIVANVLRSGPNPAADAAMLAAAPEDLAYLLDEVDRLRTLLGHTTITRAAEILDRPDPLEQLHAAADARYPGWRDQLTVDSWWLQVDDDLTLAHRIVRRFELGGYLNVAVDVYREGVGHCGQGSADGAAFVASNTRLDAAPDWVDTTPG